MGKHLLLHIGNPKCGSTALQDYMKRNRDHFSQQGIHYTHNGDGALGRVENEREIRQLGDYCDETDADKIFVSHELLSSYDFYPYPRFKHPTAIAHYLSKYFDDYKVSVFLIIRRQDTLIESSFLQTQRRLPETDFEEYVKSSSDLFYSDQIKPWVRFDALYVAPFDQYKADNKDVISWVLKETFDQEMDLPGTFEETNVKLGGDNLLPDERRREIIQKYEKDNKYVFDKYMPRFDYSWSTQNS